MRCFLGIDAGTSGVKAVVINDSGRIVGDGYAPCELITPKPNWAEQSPAGWWEACDKAVRQAVAPGGFAKDIVSIGFSGQMQGLTLLDKDMKPVNNCIIWMDQRASAEADELNARIPEDEILKIAHNFCIPSYWAAKLVWLMRNRPEDYERTHMILFPKDYLRYLITGEIATEVSDASCSWLIDVKKRAWSDRMFDVVGVSKDIIPQTLLESSDVAGYLLSDVAASWGVPAGIPVAAGGGDQPVGGVGSGIIESGMVTSVIGTSGVIFGCCEPPLADRKRRAMYSLCHSIPDKYAFLGCTLGAGGSYKWLRDTLFKEADDNSFAFMDSLAARAPVGSEGLCFLPYMSGEGTPHVDSNARGTFFGLSYRHDRGAICRSVMEGVAFSLRDTIEILRESTGLVVDEVRALGGGGKSPLWRQIQADVYGASVLTMETEEGPAVGGAILGAVAAGAHPTVEEACSALLKTATVTEPIAENVKIYDDYYATYRSLYPALKGIFASQAGIVARHSA
ncbi:MAG: xylulokinase [Clostridiales Family XIII bacterium]|jgi:xylulokinase|nr:xylulokinase [Clostridiales Family XIII bacterium]